MAHAKNQKHKMKKHRFNLFPAARTDDYVRLREDIREHGYDARQPIVLYQDSILDGWNRWLACEELKVKPATVNFDGDDSEAMAYVMRTNKRRNLNSGQWATIAVEAEDIIGQIKAQTDKEKRDKISKARHGEIRIKISGSEEESRRAKAKAAELFNTSRGYLTQAAKIKKAAPEVFEKVKAGKMTMQDASRAVKAIPTGPWLEDETERKKQVESGRSVVANTGRDKNLIQWAEKEGLSVRIDRSTEYGNPFILGDDGTRDEVCNAYAKYYLPHKPSIQAKLKSLQGKVLVCHCYPERCHGESLITDD